MQSKLRLETVYSTGMTITAWSMTFAAFFGCWGYAIWKFGWLLGLPLGWMPALVVAGIAGYMAGLIWPVVVVAVPAIAWFYLRVPT